MDSKIMDILMSITEEEERNLLGQKNKNMERIVISPEGDIIDRRKVMEQGRLIDVRKHPRFSAFPRHHHSFIEIIYMFSGTSTHVVNDTHQVVLKKGELLFLGPDVAHEIEATDYGDVALNIMILPEFLNYPNQYEQNIVFTVYKYIADNYQTATLEEFSVLMRQPDYYVSKLIKKHAGKNFKQILQQKRLNQAAYYLMHTLLPIEQIIERVGYDNSSYFHKKFKEYYGVTPKKYRDNYREENSDKNTLGNSREYGKDNTDSGFFVKNR